MAKAPNTIQVFKYKRQNSFGNRDIISLKEAIKQNQKYLFEESWSFEKYLKETFKYFNECLLNYFSENREEYLYSRGYYQSENKDLKTIQIFSQNTHQKVYFENGFNAIDNKLIESTNSFTFYNLLVKFHILGLEICTEKMENKSPFLDNFPTIYTDVTKEEIENNIQARTSSANASEIQNISETIYSYLNCAKNNKTQPVYLYLCRSRNLDNRFNSSFILVLNRRLKLWNLCEGLRVKFFIFVKKR